MTDVKRGNPPTVAECKSVPRFDDSLKNLIATDIDRPIWMMNHFPEGYKMPLHHRIEFAIRQHKAYFEKNQAVAIPLSDGTLYASPTGFLFKPSAFVKGQLA